LPCALSPENYHLCIFTKTGIGSLMETAHSLVRLNALKHHYFFLKSKMEEWIGMEWAQVREELLQLGNNQFDMYTGNLTEDEICREAGEYLLKNQIQSRTDLHKWLGKSGYKTFVLSDQSMWVVRESGSSQISAHIHPARNQKMVRRIKSSHVKTAIAIIYETKMNTLTVSDYNTLQINAIRTGRTGLSPVRSIEESRKILEIFRFLTETRF
jgi:hypothetical protein